VTPQHNNFKMLCCGRSFTTQRK